jgi:hypothetical protein
MGSLTAGGKGSLTAGGIGSLTAGGAPNVYEITWDTW